MIPPADHEPSRRQLVCARCGAAFACGLGVTCWCAEESVRLPLPLQADEDCLCPACLRHRVATNGP